MTTLWLDVSAGAAGDMILASLVDAGADLDRVRAGLAPVLGDATWSVGVDDVRRGALRALHLQVHAPEDYDHHGHTHRPWAEVRARLQHLPEPARGRALAVYGRLAAAEGRMHGVPVDEVELHEVGAFDAILDIAGTCLALDDLGVDRVVAPPLPLGTGTVRAAHGTLPLPAPATLAVLEGWPVVPGPPGEWVTPTGAALVSTLATPGPVPAMRLGRTGYGAGTRDRGDVPNVVRAVLGHEDHGGDDLVVQLSCQVDDMTGELVAPVLSEALERGALDALAIPVLMKKGRPGLLLQVLARPAEADALARYLLRHTTTLGLRHQPVRRHTLDRWHVPVVTPWGEVRVKVGGRDGTPWHAAPELADVQAVARAADIPLHEVHRAALAAWEATERSP